MTSLLTIMLIVSPAPSMAAPEPTPVHADFVEPALRAFPAGESHPIVPGVARPQRFATLAAPSEGTLATIHIEAGMSVELGAPIATMDDGILRAAEESASAAAEHNAAVSRALHVLEMRRRNLQRKEEGHASGGVHLSELEDARSELAIADAELRLEQERLRDAQLAHMLARARLEALTVRAPFAGVVVRVIARAGETLQLGEPIATIARLDHLRVEIDLPASWIADLEPGAIYPLDAEAPIARTLPARLVNVEPILDPATSSVRCVFAIDNRRRALRAGFTVLPHTGPYEGPVDALSAPDGYGLGVPMSHWLALPNRHALHD